MAAKTGANSLVAGKTGAAHGVAASLGTGDKWTGAQVTRNLNPIIIRPSPMGSGRSMDVETEAVGTGPSLSIACQGKYDGPDQAAEALFFGASSVAGAGGSLYAHSFVFDATRNQKFMTIAFEGSSAETYEYPSCTPSKLTLQFNPNDYLQRTIDFLANTEVISGQTNDNAALAATTEASTARVIVKTGTESTFRLNAQAGGALSGSDLVAITQATLELEFPIQHSYEIDGTAGNGTPISTGDAPYMGTLTVTLRNNSDFTYQDAQAAGTLYKADLTVTNSDSYEEQYCLPCIKLVQDPAWGLQNPSDNPATLTFKCLAVTAHPTGMINGYPYKRVINTNEHGYLS